MRKIPIYVYVHTKIHVHVYFQKEAVEDKPKMNKIVIHFI